ncbi:kinase-like domain-containing protein [Desarmillaria tabescens]|uniref:Kinase-like domain-containing protein n=1 Tax=Armillaria tabescens TaxID=1929756 RepID=A0AA39TNA3_ARMTA|nr:kinase-like domain-containing protein [Desarmillaria tabescens]KAK0460708.1 kinase-like domain-containing protein [Desarmillaria tabescens]
MDITQCHRTWLSTYYVKLRIFVGRILYDQPRYKGTRYGSRVVQIGPKSLLKRTSIVEAKTMALVSRLTSLPIPHLRHVWVDHNVQQDGRQMCWVVMEYMPGRTWDQAWPDLSSKERDKIQGQMRNYINQLREIRPDGLPDGYVGPVGNHHCWDYKLDTSQAYGPFPSLQSFYDHLLSTAKKLNESIASRIHSDLLNAALSHSPSSQSIFTHSDLVPRNILIHNGEISAILDWEQSGWWPYWWEHSKSLYALGPLTEEDRKLWSSFVAETIPLYNLELDLDIGIYEIVGPQL